MKKDKNKKNIKEELTQLESMSDKDIDLSDIPEITNWNDFEVGRFYRPIKKQISIRLDLDLLEWFKHQSGKYQTLINQACREYKKRHIKSA